MSRFDRQALWNLDWILIIVTLLIAVFSVLTVYSATKFATVRPFHLRQIGYYALGLSILFTILFLDYRRLLRYQAVVFWFAILLLVYLDFKGGAGDKVDRYLKIWRLPVITPSEFLKFALILRFAQKFRSQRLADVRTLDLLGPSLAFLFGLGLILKQPDLGTALILAPIFITQVFVAGYDYRKMLVILIIGFAGVIGSAKQVLKPYQYERLTGFLTQGENTRETGWQLHQSKVAIGSGGFWGRGYLNGTQAKLEFLPAKHTDFILAVFAEEWGFFGVFILFSLYLIWLYRAFRIARQANDASGVLVGAGVCALISAQLIINSGMIVGLLPITGITLPFMSYGGSSIITNMACLGILLSVGLRRA